MKTKSGDMQVVKTFKSVDITFTAESELDLKILYGLLNKPISDVEECMNGSSISKLKGDESIISNTIYNMWKVVDAALQEARK